MNKNTQVKISYDVQEFPFREVIEEVLGTKFIEKIHLEEEYEVFVKGTDQSTTWHRRYYSNLDKFLPHYEKFIYEVIRPQFQEEIVYQKVPTFRTQLVNNLGVFSFHKDRDYQHNQEELNFFLPITDAYSTNTIWVESEEDKADYAPITALYGETVMWNGCHLSHGNKLNNTSNTRISVDFRVIPISKYQEDPNTGSIYTKMKFAIGDYYSVTK